MSARGNIAALLLGTSLCAASPALAGGYDTPILYSAQHMGMGGAAIAYVDDPTAMFHNPAGIARTEGLTLTLNATLILGTIQSTPSTDSKNLDSNDITALAPLAGVTVKPLDWLAFGFGFYPVASAGAEYEYKNALGGDVTNSTDVVFLEMAPTVAFHLPGNVNIGASWRIVLASLDRQLDDPNPSNPNFDASLSGSNVAAFRVGAQWDPIPELQIGVVFRNKTTTTLVDDSGVAIGGTPKRIETDFVLPAKLGFGVRLKLDPVRVAADVEYAFQSQNEKSTFLLGPNKQPGLVPIVSYFEWHNATTLRLGVEYALQERFFFRGGFIYDSQVSNEDFPSAFGTPPTSSTTVTAGFGLACGNNWKLNFAFAHRFAETDVPVNPSPDPDKACLPCSQPGHYQLSMTGLYVDFTYAFADLFK